MRSSNHPRKGSIIKVEPIREKKDIDLIKQLLADSPRDLTIFVFGINTNLRASDLLRITIGQVRHLEPDDSFEIREKKTGKLKNMSINKTVYEAIPGLLTNMQDQNKSDYLFQSRKGKGALTVAYINSLVKSWCKKINLRGNYGSHTLRKTFGYLNRTVFHTDLPTLMTLFNHSSQKQTLAYLCIQPQEIKDA